jgi:hypothetical protein
MANTLVKVELGFRDLSGSNFFTLNDAVKGRLDSEIYRLGGDYYFVDISQYLKTLTISRGKSRELDRFSAGQCSVVFNNTTRVFDPEYASSPLQDEIVPTRYIRVSLDNEVSFIGIIDDWDLNYTTDGQAEATANAFDGIINLAKALVLDQDFPAETSGVRIGKILDLPEIGWPTGERSISLGDTTLGEETVLEGTDAFSYLEQIVQTEQGELFIDKSGNITFLNRNASQGTISVTLADDGTGLSYSDLSIVYGSELLTNQAVVTSVITDFTATASNLESQKEFGVRGLELNNTLYAFDTDVQFAADYLVNKFSDPELRFESIALSLTNRSEIQRDSILGLEIGNLISIRFTPNKVGSAINKIAKIIGIEHSIAPGEHTMLLRLSSTDNNSFILNSASFGRLDNDRLGW